LLKGIKYIKKAPKQEFSHFSAFSGAGRTPKRMNVSLRTIILERYFF
jgi:hypothetical protein